jgi:SAM-dependent methyltransferase
MISRAKEKAREKNLNIDFKIGDAHHLPFEDNEFDVVIAECAVCALDKEMAIAEMIRVVTPGGFIGIHDICWKEDTPYDLKVRLKEIENESPETLEGWKKLFCDAGLENCSATDKSHLMPTWMKSSKQSLGFAGQLRIGIKVFQKWGITGVKTIMESEKIFKSPFTGYGIIVGRKPAKN